MKPFCFTRTIVLIVDNSTDTQGGILFTVLINITMDNLTITVLAIIILFMISNSKSKKMPEKKKDGDWGGDKKGGKDKKKK